MLEAASRLRYARRMSKSAPDGLLAGVRVLDFGRYIAGPYCAALLADLGAEVIRIERVEGGEDRFLLPVAEDGAGALFLAMNRNKRSLTLDPGSPEGRQIVQQLVARSDVVVANLPPDVLKSLGLDLESLRAIRPDIILTTTTAFGPGGPWSHRHGFDGIGQAMSGAVYLSGTPEQPVRSAAHWVDFGTACLSAFGTLAALMSRERAGHGQKVETALLHTAIAFGNGMLIEQALAQTHREAIVNRGFTSAPSDMFRTRDGWILVACIGNPMFRRIAKMLGETAWLTDPRFGDDLERGHHGVEISARVARWAAELSSEEALQALEAASVPAAPVLSPQQALDHPHIRASGMLKPVDYPGTSAPAPLARVPFNLSAAEEQIDRRAPLLGEHTDEILGELGYTTAEIAELRTRRVI